MPKRCADDECVSLELSMLLALEGCPKTVDLYMNGGDRRDVVACLLAEAGVGRASQIIRTAQRPDLAYYAVYSGQLRCLALARCISTIIRSKNAYWAYCCIVDCPLYVTAYLDRLITAMLSGVDGLHWATYSRYAKDINDAQRGKIRHAAVYHLESACPACIEALRLATAAP